MITFALKVIELSLNLLSYLIF